MNNRIPLVAAALAAFALAPACEPDPAPRTATPARQARTGPTPVEVPATAPRVRLRVSGNLAGYLKPCGCASGQMGGLARRAFRNKLDRRNIDLLLEGGHLIKRPGLLDMAKLQTILEILSGEGGYHAVGLAHQDLAIGAGGARALCSRASPSYRRSPRTWSPRTAPPGRAGKTVLAHPFREIDLKKVKVRVASLAMRLPEGAKRPRASSCCPPKQGWKRALEGVDPATYRVVMIHADRDAIRKLRFTPKPDLIVAVSDDYVEPPSRADEAHGVPMVYTGEHGRILVDVTLARTPQGPVLTRYKRVLLEASKTAPNAMRDGTALAKILGHRNMVRDVGMLEMLANQRAIPGGLTYVGGKRCAECHEDEDTTCGKHAHSRAWQTLVDAEKREGWPVTHYPECVSCHVVGYGEKSGFVTPKQTPKLLNVTCENCHGPGSAHADDDSKPMPHKPSVKTCTKCHNFEHSPKFDYQKYWKKITHGG